jgi:hypothetical protein
MKTFFSKRHPEIYKQKKKSLSFPKTVRVSIAKILETHSDFGGYDNSDNFTFDVAEETLKTFYGIENLLTFDEKDQRKPTSFKGVIISGYPHEVIDCVEAWFDAGPQATDKCEKELNDFLAMNQSPWRFVNGDAILVDSEYLHSEVQARTLRLLRSNQAFGALDEFQSAIRDLQSGETKDAIVKAHKSVESVMKTALGTQEHLTFGRLLSDLIHSGIVPDYYDDFLKHFEKIALGAVKERNRPGCGHGQGLGIAEVGRSLAEFAINLAGTINLFIIQRWIECQKVEAKVQEPPSDDYIPF